MMFCFIYLLSFQTHGWQAMTLQLAFMILTWGTRTSPWTIRALPWHRMPILLTVRRPMTLRSHCHSKPSWQHATIRLCSCLDTYHGIQHGTGIVMNLHVTPCIYHESLLHAIALPRMLMPRQSIDINHHDTPWHYHGRLYCITTNSKAMLWAAMTIALDTSRPAIAVHTNAW